MNSSKKEKKKVLHSATLIFCVKTDHKTSHYTEVYMVTVSHAYTPHFLSPNYGKIQASVLMDHKTEN